MDGLYNNFVDLRRPETNMKIKKSNVLKFLINTNPYAIIIKYINILEKNQFILLKKKAFYMTCISCLLQELHVH